LGAVTYEQKVHAPSFENRPMLVDQPANGRGKNVGAVPSSEGAYESEQIRIKRNTQGCAYPSHVTGIKAIGIEHRPIDTIGIEEDPFRWNAKR
jgi:hypothetical protein